MQSRVVWGLVLATAVLALVAVAVFTPSIWSLSDKGASSGSLNISWFVYRDVNRNGIYDLADRPYAGLPVQLTRPDGSARTHHSNINGFANFKMSRDASAGVIHSAAPHTFTARIPSQWEVTSGAREETVSFAERVGAPAGLIAERVMEPLGVAPVPRIVGQVGGSAQRYALRAIDPQGRARRIELTRGGGFSLTGMEGVWQLVRENLETGEETRRDVTMGFYPQVLSAAYFSDRARAADGPVVTVRYDDLITTNTVYEIPNGYRGLQWKNWLVTHNLFYQGAGYVNATVSSEFLAYNSSGHPARIAHDRPFDFEGSYIGVAWPQARRGRVHVKAYRGDQLVHHDQLQLDPRAPVYFHAGYRGITAMEIFSELYWQVVVDDSRFRLPR